MLKRSITGDEIRKQINQDWMLRSFWLFSLITREWFIINSFHKVEGDNVRRKRSEFWPCYEWMLHYDNAPTYLLLVTCVTFAKKIMTDLPQLQYLPDLTPAHFFVPQVYLPPQTTKIWYRNQKIPEEEFSICFKQWTGIRLNEL